MAYEIPEIDRRAAEDVFAERARQVLEEGFGPQRDVELYGDRELAKAAICYAFPVFGGSRDDSNGRPIPDNWPWHTAFWKPSTPRRNLVKAGALILAEIARIERSETNPKTRNQLGREAEVDLMNEIDAELGRARTKFPGNNVTFAALVEEVGELATATFSENRRRVREEAVQVAVMAVRMVLDGDHTFDEWRAEHELDPLTAGKTS